MTTKISSALILGFMFCFSTVGGGCQRSRIAASTAATANAAQPSPTKQVSSKVTRVVFVGKEHACDCTRKTVDAGWAALQKALGTPAKLPTERLLVDTQGPKVEPYRNQKPIMALPAIYFLDRACREIRGADRDVCPSRAAWRGQSLIFASRVSVVPAFRSYRQGNPLLFGNAPKQLG